MGPAELNYYRQNPVTCWIPVKLALLIKYWCLHPGILLRLLTQSHLFFPHAFGFSYMKTIWHG